MSSYRWEVTVDHLGIGDSIKGTSGPADHDPEIADNKTRFALYDDDGERYASGFLYGDFDGFEPLDDFGGPSLGCTGIKIDGDWL